jgi:hypothetical protein
VVSATTVASTASRMIACSEMYFPHMSFIAALLDDDSANLRQIFAPYYPINGIVGCNSHRVKHSGAKAR